MTNTTIAFIGLGNMGGPMAANLADAGYTVRAFDLSDEAKARAREAGISTHDSATDAARDATVVITMLPNGALVNQVIDEVLPHVADGCLFIDSSTIAITDAEEAHAKAVDAGHSFIDAPVSGGVGGARAGTLAFMVGGDADAVTTARPLLDIMGRATTHCGPLGAGQAAKLCNNMVLAVQQLAISEAMVLGERLGLSPEAFHSVVSNSTGACWALTTNCPVPGPVPESPANHDFKPGFATALMVKDLRLAMAAIESSNSTATLGMTVAAEYEKFLDAGNGHLDFSAIINTVRD